VTGSDWPVNHGGTGLRTKVKSNKRRGKRTIRDEREPRNALQSLIKKCERVN
jgi:hypothetical protein